MVGKFSHRFPEFISVRSMHILNTPATLFLDSLEGLCAVNPRLQGPWALRTRVHRLSKQQEFCC
ncbi:hypothetical protein K443DRAFT_676150 [Laccaria amethystina LaAM-08-1]|uniref:Uncharacterized protein n=1 Tax=Laccaria amethystina LaAM-08-1 TaxID=1095629 RepID=A0A0C9XR83_9AGAR|nr:hypothetical protein K443DRAFT_676150 [Laccaria amethystina LaAM-08-1]